MAKDKLTDRQCALTKPGERNRVLPDGQGLRLVVHPNGQKYWQIRFTFAGKESTYGVGTYPGVTLAAARKERDRVHAEIRNGRNPVIARKVQRTESSAAQQHTFKAVARQWLERGRTQPSPRTRRPWSANHLERNQGLIERILEPRLGIFPISEITEAMLVRELTSHYERGLQESARRAAAIANQIFRYARERHLFTGPNPASELLSFDALSKPEVTNFAALSQEQVGPLMKALRSGKKDPVTAAGLLMTIYTGLRDHSLRGATWSEIDFDAAIWTIPASRMKSRREHSVPLPRQAIAILRNLQTLKESDFVFAGRGKAGYLAENTLRAALHGMGFKVTAHGMRSLLTDVLAENAFNRDAIEAQLDHAERDQTRKAYLRTRFWEQRVPMMQWFADWCDAQMMGKDAPAMVNVVAMKSASL